MSKFDDLFKKYSCDALSEQTVKQDIESILAKTLMLNNNVEVYKQCLNLIDLTSLSGTDTHTEIKSMVDKVNDFKSSFPQLPNVAAICVYPALVPVVKRILKKILALLLFRQVFRRRKHLSKWKWPKQLWL